MMANISITLNCNRKCDYCFASKARDATGRQHRKMSRDTFLSVLDLLKRSGINQVRLLGGEPTLHPDFVWMVKKSIQQELRVLVFSNGLIDGTILNFLVGLPERRVSVLINVNSPDEQSQREQKLQANTFSVLRKRVFLGFNIHSPDFNLLFLQDLIQQYGLNPQVRLGLAHPCIDGNNTFLHPRYYEQVGQRITKFAEQMEKERISLDFDCGFVPCMFPPEFFNLKMTNQAAIGSRCNPLPDILPNGTIVPCYSLFSVCQMETSPGLALENLRVKLTEKLAAYRHIGIFRECAVCKLKQQNVCMGGCLAAAIHRSRSVSFRISTPHKSSDIVSQPKPGVETHIDSRGPEAASHAGIKIVIPYVDQPREFWQQIKTDFGNNILEVYIPTPGNLIASARPPQPILHLNDLLLKPPFRLSILVNTPTFPVMVHEIAPMIIDELRKWHDRFGISSVTVSSLALAVQIREHLPSLSLNASTLMDIAGPHQAMMLNGICDVLVPASRIARDINALRQIRKAFVGRIRLLVNEACLPGCLFRAQHFRDMSELTRASPSLCNELLDTHPWLRLTGAWILPQHLHFFEGIYDEIKLAGRVTLQDPRRYRDVLSAYISRKALQPHQIGGGPASVLEPINITEDFFAYTLQCSKQCHVCTRCRDYWQTTRGEKPGFSTEQSIYEGNSKKKL